MARHARPGVRRHTARFHTFDSLRHRNYRLLWSATLIVSSSQFLQQVAVGWLTYELTRSPLLTTLALAVESLPYLLASPIGGVIADRWDRRQVLSMAYLYNAVVTGVIATTIMLGQAEVWHVFAFVLSIGLSGAISGPARQSLIPRIVPRESLVNAFALNSLAFNATRLAVPAVAGVLVAVTGPGKTLGIGVALYLIASMTIMAIRLADTYGPDGAKRSPFAEFFEGARYVAGQPMLLGTIMLGAFTYMLIIPSVTGLMPVYASEVYGVGPAGLGLLMSAIGVGATLGVVVLATLGNIYQKGRAIIVGLWMLVVGTIVFTQSTSVALSVPPLVLVGAGLITYTIVRGAALQLVAPDRLRGRVSSLNQMGFSLSPLGGIAIGGLAEVWGAPAATLIAGCVMAIILAGLSLGFREIWRFN